MNEIISYLIRFLIGEVLEDKINENILIGYTNDPKQFEKYNLVIIPSGFFNEDTYGKPSSLPLLPLVELEGIPIIYGSPEVEWVGDTLVVHADLIASAYFLVSRYEEMIRRDVRDKHGRFPGKESLPYRAGFIHRPILDEYRLLIHQWLREFQPELPEAGNHIYFINLTHDVDEPFLYRSWKGLIRSIRDGRGILCSLKGKFGKPVNDPFFTFPWLLDQNRQLSEKLEGVNTIAFFRAGGKTSFDKPHYSPGDRDINKLARKFKKEGADIGLHVSYEAGLSPRLIEQEKENMQMTWCEAVLDSRHHFLTCREPEDMDYLEKAGIVWDYTMGYADVTGFRLGTGWNVQYINPVTRRLTDLKLTPLIIMDCTLERDTYMGLSYDEAVAYSCQLIDNAWKAGGSITFLWHNTSVVEGNGSYLRKLYPVLLDYIIKICSK
ncbi:hypothetical protein AGMMS49574_13180 [Bacteroidia bacterium]|nr:hypothetical protein AGMMS49574_13180 [Bacteroidia bacterium]